MAFQNLKSELVRKGIKQYEVAAFLGMTNSNFNKKLSEAIPTTRDEMFAIQGEFFPELSVDHLFASDGNVPSERERATSRVQALAENIMTDGTPMDAEKAEIVNDLFASSERYDPTLVNHVLNV